MEKTSIFCVADVVGTEPPWLQKWHTYVKAFRLGFTVCRTGIRLEGWGTAR